MKPRGLVAALLVVAFVLGGIEGALGFSLYQTWIVWWRLPETRFQQDRLRRLPKELALRPEQQEQVEAILRETEQEVARLRAEIDPEVQATWGRARARIRDVLDAEQQAKFNFPPAEWER
jgi:hypothetical protein